MKTRRAREDRLADRRGDRRAPVKILVRCLPVGVSLQRNGHTRLGWDMWTRDVAKDGVGLHWSRRWAFRNCPHCFHQIANIPCPTAGCHCSHGRMKNLQPGERVHISDLVYTDRGSRIMDGVVRWVRRGKGGQSFDIGIRVTAPRHRQDLQTIRDA